ncbi:uncharacterized protein LTR77_007442 [Saxophila tyrrhenica]|uniref:Transmembrane protein n=1 Tax=Saxophila tyrrhenica TaxID=1690608 RepID=A0AAV9P563_9PEZI|nr:hypothetical protein LTR77_007442 [Saxophila tyrrhenica]
MPDDDDPDTIRFAYTIPSREVIEVVKAVAATGAVLPIAPPGPNSSWALDFSGPALKCTNISEPLRSEIRSNIASATGSASNCEAYGYLAWLEGMPFLNTSQTNASGSGEHAFNSRIFQGSSMPAVLYLAASPEAMRRADHESPPAACSKPAASLYAPEAGGLMLECALQSASYHTAFDYINGLQDVDLSTVPLDETTIQTVSSVNCTTAHGSEGSCDFTPGILRTLSFQAVMDAVAYLLTGFVSAEGNATAPFMSTQVISTALISTPELHFLTQPILEQDSTAGARTLQQNVLAWSSTRDQGLVKSDPRSPTSSLAETIEDLFKNATVSMMSQQHLQPNASSAFAPPPVNVTHRTFHNVYTYSKTKLWITYSVAITVTAITAILGLIAVAASGASYSSSNSFSSAFRLARGAMLSTDMRNEDFDGRDPLPAHLAKAKMWPEHTRTSQASRVDSILLSRRSRTSSIALSERPKTQSRRSSASLLGVPPDIEPPTKPWSAF